MLRFQKKMRNHNKKCYTLLKILENVTTRNFVGRGGGRRFQKTARMKDGKGLSALADRSVSGALDSLTPTSGGDMPKYRACFIPISCSGSGPGHVVFAFAAADADGHDFVLRTHGFAVVLVAGDEVEQHFRKVKCGA